MQGSLALVGSGEFLPEMAEFEASLINDGMNNGKRAIYVQIPTAAGQESRERLRYWEDLGRKQADLLQVEHRFLPIFTREDADKKEFVNQLEDAALIYMSGGDPHYLSNTLRESPTWEAIERNFRFGSSLAGCSAGAMVLSSHIPNFRLTKSEPTQGLDLLPNARVIPHFDKFFRWIPSSAAKILMHAPDNVILLGIDELTAIVKRSGEKRWMVEGRAKVHILQGLPKQELQHGEMIQLDPV